MITARRSIATERRGAVHRTGRHAAMAVAATAVLTGGLVGGCASRPATAADGPKPRPGNQDTASAQRAAARGEAAARPAPAPAPIPSTTGPWQTDADAETGLGALLAWDAPHLAITPPQAPGSSRPSLVVIGMPVWLWVVSPQLTTTVATTGDVVTDRWKTDKAVWYLDGGLWKSCDGTAPNAGPGVPYDAGDPDVANTGPRPVADACVAPPFTAPYYSSDPVAGTVEGLHTAIATVTRHVEYRVGTGPWQTLVPQPVLRFAIGPFVQFRVGEIQSLVTVP